MKKVWFLVVMFMIFIGSGCVTVYRFNNVNYDTPEKALSAQLLTQAKDLEQITPTDTPINGSVVVILPSETLILEKYVKMNGNPSQIQINFFVSFFKNAITVHANALKNRKLFTDIKVIDSEKPEDTSFSEDFAVYAIPGQWFLKNKEGTPIPIQFNHKLPTPKERLMDWLGNIEKAAK